MEPIKLRISSTTWLFNRRYILTVAVYSENIAWGVVRTPEGELVVSIQGRSYRFHSIEIGKNSIILGDEPFLIDLGKRTTRAIPKTNFEWNHVLMSPDESTLFLAGEDNQMGSPMYQFYDLTGEKVTPIESPSLNLFIGYDLNDNGDPGIMAFAITELHWDKSTCAFVWTEKRPYYTELNMWGSEAEDLAAKLHISSEEQCNFLESQKRETRIYSETILVRRNNAMVKLNI